MLGLGCIAREAIAWHRYPEKANQPMNAFWIICFTCSIGLELQTLEAQSEEQVGARQQLAEAVARFMASNADLQPNDLLVHSDLLELQQYLIQTNREGPLTSPRVLNRVLEDRSALSRLYHRRGGDALRTAAEALGSYEPLNRLARAGSGQKILRDAIDSGSVVALLRTIETLEREQRPTRQSSIIYTTRELILEYVGTDIASNQPSRQ